MLKILMIEDDLELAAILSEYLESHGISVTSYDEPYTGMSALNTHHFDLLLLDLTLPNLDGLEVCKRVAKNKNIPIIISSARNDTNDKIKGLEFGADDYLPKPYDPKELIARIYSVLRRYHGTPKNMPPAAHKPFELHEGSREILYHGELLDLTRAEYEILAHLIKRNGAAISREEISLSSPSINPESSNKSIDVIIGRLRSKIEADPKSPKFIISVRGIGYRLNNGEK